MKGFRWAAGLWLGLLLALGVPAAKADGVTIPWVVYYAAELPPTAFYGFDLVVFESDSHPPLEPLVDRRKKVIGYISLGEVNETRPYFAEVKAEGLYRGENENWKGSYFVDVRDAAGPSGWSRSWFRRSSGAASRGSSSTRSTTPGISSARTPRPMPA